MLTITKKDDHIILEGIINETADFTALFEKCSDRAIIDFSQVKHANSIGIRKFIEALYSTELFIEYIKVPVSVVGYINEISELLTENTTIRSCYVPFYCSSCDEEHDKLINIVEHIPDPENIKLPEFSCECGGGTLTMEEDEDAYFLFLMNNAQIYTLLTELKGVIVEQKEKEELNFKQVRVQVSDHPKLKGRWFEIRNLCLSGGFMKTPVVIKVGENFVGKITLPKIGVPLDINCQVGWVSEFHGLNGEMPNGMGINFIDLSENSRSLIKKFMQTYYAY